MKSLINSVGQIMDDSKIITPINSNILNDISSGALVTCCKQSENILTVETFNGDIIEVDVTGYKMRGYPKYKIGENVLIINKNITGTVRYIVYHFNKHELYYMLIIKNKLSSKWYFEPELTKVSAN